VDASAVDTQSEGTVRANLLRLIRPIAGEVTIVKAEPVRDQAGRIIAYRALIHK
jgi:hypothetical protein